MKAFVGPRSVHSIKAHHDTCFHLGGVGNPRDVGTTKLGRTLQKQGINAFPLIPMPAYLMTVVAYIVGSRHARGHCEMIYHAKAM